MCGMAPLHESKPPKAPVSLVLETEVLPKRGPALWAQLPAHLGLQSLPTAYLLRTPHSGPSRKSPELRVDAPQSHPCSLTKSVLTGLPA